MRVLAVSMMALAVAAGLASLSPTAAQVAGATAAQDPAVQGKRLFIRCASCHAMAAGGPARIGPHLAGVVGRKAGGLPGFAYSPAMKKQAFVWTDATLDRWLARPSAVVPGTSMAFAGLSKPANRAALIAYMKKPAQ